MREKIKKAKRFRERKKKRTKGEKKAENFEGLLLEVRPLFEERFKLFQLHSKLNVERLLSNDVEEKKSLALKINAVLDKTVGYNRQICLKLKGDENENDSNVQ